MHFRCVSYIFFSPTSNYIEVKRWKYFYLMKQFWKGIFSTYTYNKKNLLWINVIGFVFDTIMKFSWRYWQTVFWALITKCVYFIDAIFVDLIKCWLQIHVNYNFFLLLNAHTLIRNILPILCLYHRGEVW